MSYVILWLETLKESHTSVKFGGHKHRGSGDITVLVCHLIWQDHMTKGSSNMVTILPSLVATCTLVVKI